MLFISNERITTIRTSTRAVNEKKNLHSICLSTIRTTIITTTAIVGKKRHIELLIQGYLKALLAVFVKTAKLRNAFLFYLFLVQGLIIYLELHGGEDPLFKLVVLEGIQIYYDALYSTKPY